MAPPEDTGADDNFWRLQKMAAVGQVGAGITHEVRNVMTGILGFTQVAKKRAAEGEPHAELLDLIEEEALRCLDLLGNYLDFVRMRPRERAVIDVRQVAQTVSKLAAHHAGMTHVKVSLVLAPDTPLVEGSAGELQQVVLNLVMNAVQAMPNGGRIEVETRAGADGSVELRVKDDGPGMTEEIRARIFEPFFTTKPPGQGSGLGLAVSRAIVRDHGGSIDVASTPGAGTLFTVKLPARDAR